MNIDGLVIVLMAVGLVIFLGEPFLRRLTVHELASEENSEVEQLSLQKETLYTAIHDLDFDFQTDKVDAADYGELRRHLEGEALQVLRSLDAVDPMTRLDNELEQQILVLRQQQGNKAHSPSHDACFGCGASLQGEEKFCPFCGQNLLPA